MGGFSCKMSAAGFKPASGFVRHRLIFSEPSTGHLKTLSLSLATTFSFRLNRLDFNSLPLLVWNISVMILTQMMDKSFRALAKGALNSVRMTNDLLIASLMETFDWL